MRFSRVRVTRDYMSKQTSSSTFVPSIDPELKKWASPRESEAIEALLQFGSIANAAEKLGVTPSRVRGYLSEARRRAAKKGYSPSHDMTRTVPEGFHVKGVSSFYGKEGALRGQWVKSQKDQEHRFEILMDALQELAEPFKGKSALVEPPKTNEKDLLAVYPMGDPHLGMYSWAEETGQNFDLDIGERNLVAAVDMLVDLAPACEEALIINVGDFFHSDTMDNQTRRSGHALDVDTRWSRVLSVGIKAMRRCIESALRKHKRVRVICEIGNHDDHSAIMLAICLASYYENNPRVQVDVSPAPFHWYRFGENLIGVTHGNNVKPDQLPGIMAHDRKKDWGETSFRYWYTGHIHHDTLKEFPGCIVETFRTLAARDAWHNGKGYRSGQDMKLDVIHRKYGRINRHSVGIEQITDFREAPQAKKKAKKR